MSFRLVLKLASRLEIGSLTMLLPDGRALRATGARPGPDGVLIVRDFRFAARVMRSGNCGFGEAYVANEWDSPDPSTLIEVLSSNSRHLMAVLQGHGIYKLLQRAFHLLHRNSKAGAKRNIHAHYDLGNEFYRLWLDPTMTYSSARYAKGDEDLSTAQINKYRALARSMGLQAGQSVLEIGCGWGGFAEFAAGEVGCKVTGITISQEQLEFARRRIFEKGLASRVDLKFQDYRDVSGKYDRVASIEMFEAVGREYWPAFFEKVRDVLKEGGQAGLQIITIKDELFETYKRGTDFIQRYVFPGGMLPSPSALREEIAKVGLQWKDHVAFGKDYAHTLNEWRRRFVTQWPKIEKIGFDERFQRLWKCYLSFCEGGFRSGSIDVMQIALKR
ncbi:MAG: cyclopropane-fatty-acyl-phospholipid synthase family protein [Alphaproteobacteria bacterium]